MLDAKAKQRLEPILAEFRKGLALHRAEGATEERIQQILSASVRLAVQQVDDPALCIWLCDQFSNAANAAPIMTDVSRNISDVSRRARPARSAPRS